MDLRTDILNERAQEQAFRRVAGITKDEKYMAFLQLESSSGSVKLVKHNLYLETGLVL